MYFLQNISYLSGNPVFLCCFRTGTVRKLRIEEYGEAERAGGTPLVDGWSRISFWRWSMTWWTFYTNIKMYVYDFASRWTPATKDDTQKRVLKQIDCIQFPKNSCSSIYIVFFQGRVGPFWHCGQIQINVLFLGFVITTLHEPFEGDPDEAPKWLQAQWLEKGSEKAGNWSWSLLMEVLVLEKVFLFFCFF